MTDNNSSSDGDCFPSNEQIHIIGWISIACGTVSFLFCLFTFFLAVLFQKYRSTTQRVILYLTLAIALYSLVFILHGVRNRVEDDVREDEDPVCIISAFFDQVASFMEIIALSCLTFDLFVKVVFLYFNTERFEIIYVLLIFLLPFLFSWIPFINKTYGFAGSYCWIKQYENFSCSDINHFGLVLRFTLYWVPFYLLMTAVVIAHIISLVKAKKRIMQYSGMQSHGEQTIRELLLTEVRQYRLYPFITLFVFSLALISRIAEAIKTNESFFALRVVHVIALTLQGPLVSCVFALDSETRRQLSSCQRIREALFRLFCVCKIRRVHEYQAIYERNPKDSLYGISSTQRDAIEDKTNDDISNDQSQII